MTPKFAQLIRKNRNVDKVPCDFEDVPGWRHRKTKGTLVVCRRPGCRRHAFRVHPGPILAGCFHPRFGLGTLIERCIKIATLGLMQAESGEKKGCNACKVRKVALNAMFSISAPWWYVRLLQLVGIQKPQALPWDDEKARLNMEPTTPGLLAQKHSR